MKELYLKYKEVIMYLIFGVLTTVVNIVVYYIMADMLHIHYMVSNVVAWFLSVLFASYNFSRIIDSLNFPVNSL